MQEKTKENIHKYIPFLDEFYKVTQEKSLDKVKNMNKELEKNIAESFQTKDKVAYHALGDMKLFISLIRLGDNNNTRNEYQSKVPEMIDNFKTKWDYKN